MSSLAETVLSVALMATSGAVLLLYRRLRNLGADLATYRAALAESTDALNQAGAAVGLLVGEGKDVAFALARGIAEARALQSRRQPPTPQNLKSVA